ncbi:MAG TPA: hypothetical protein VK610_02995 [Rhodothermales bacterium]|nr:hypothetical protein [Rhodothermales bacterium]
MVDWSFGWAARDDERLPETVAGLHVLVFVALMLRRRVDQGLLGP